MNKIVQELFKHKKIILTTHVNPDGDALGSLYALSNALKQCKIKTSIIVDNKQCNIPFKIKSSKLKKINKNSLVVVVDACEKTRLPMVIQNSQIAKFIFIDHHKPNNRIKNVRYFISNTASSTGEIIYVLITKYLKLKITKKIAKGIYTALITDTRSFKYARTTALSHKIASRFIEEKFIEPELIQRAIYNKQTASYMNFVGYILSNFKVYKNIASIMVPKNILKKFKISEQETKSCFHDLFSIQNIVCVVFVYEKTNHNIVIIKTTTVTNFSSFLTFEAQINKYSCSFKTPKNLSFNKILKNVAKCVK